MPDSVAMYGVVLGLGAGGVLLAQFEGAPPVVSTGQGIVIGSVIAAAITAFGTAILQPYFKERATQSKYEEAVKAKAEVEARRATLEIQARESEDVKQRLIAQLRELTDKNIRLAHLLLVAGGRLRPGEAPTGMLVGDTPPAHPGPRVLLVEDSPQAREPLGIMLETAGCLVEAVATLAEGIEALDRGPDVVVLDLMLPDGDGIEVLRKVRLEKRDVRVVITTGRAEEQLAPVRALRPEALLKKPFDFVSELLPAIRRSVP